MIRYESVDSNKLLTKSEVCDLGTKYPSEQSDTDCLTGRLRRPVRPLLHHLYGVQVREDSNLSITKKSRDRLYSMKPWDYLNALSSPEERIEVRAVLHTSEPLISYAHRVRESAISNLRLGLGISHYMKGYSIVKDSIHNERNFDLQSRIEVRYINYCISEIAHTKYMLSKVFRLCRKTLCFPLLRNGKFNCLRSNGDNFINSGNQNFSTQRPLI